MQNNDLTILIGGQAGIGINRAGFLIGRLSVRGGLHAYGSISYQSLIRGGHNFYTATIRETPVYTQKKDLDLIISLNAETATLHVPDLVPGGGVIFDSEGMGITPKDLKRTDVQYFDLPMKRILEKDLKQKLIMQNSVALGATTALLNYDQSLLHGVIQDSFKESIVSPNLKAVDAGFAYANTNWNDKFGYKLSTLSNHEPLIFPSGNEAIALGALQAGCTFCAAYPMTPSSGVLHYLAGKERQHNMIVIHPESEIAAITMVAGAASAGARAITTTSGG